MFFLLMIFKELLFFLGVAISLIIATIIILAVIAKIGIKMANK